MTPPWGDIVSMPVGVELDELVADHVLKMERLPNDLGVPGLTGIRWLNTRRQYIASCPPRFSKEMGHAWQVVETLSDRYHWRLSTPFALGQQHWAGLSKLGEQGLRPDWSVGAATMPHAICLVALFVELPPDATRHAWAETSERFR